MLDKTRTPKRRKRTAFSRSDWEAWIRAAQATRLPTIAEAPYAASNVLFSKDRPHLDDLFPSVPTDIRADEDLHACVQARWPTVAAKEHKMIETMMRAHPNISDRTLRIYLGLRRGSVPKEEW